MMNSKKVFANKMLNWYDVNGRDLPFRRTRDPYKIWLSEIMAQQTQIATVIPYYENFVSEYSDFQSLANAKEDAVFKLWEGLGYYSRARRLIPCAQIIMDEYNGIFPTQLSQVLSLPGIGDYTAGAILSICYGKKVPAVDGNVLRALTRYWADDGDIAKEKVKKAIAKRITPFIPDRAGDFNQSLIELGAVVCTKSSPKCDKCPVSDDCKAYQKNDIGAYPYKSKKKKAPTYDVAISVVRHGERYLVCKKEGGGLLSGFWAFPYEVVDGSEENYFVKEALAVTDDLVGQPVGSVKHVFSHQIWQMTINLYQIDDSYIVSDENHKWVTLDEMPDLAFTTAMKKVIQVVFDSQRDGRLLTNDEGIKN